MVKKTIRELIETKRAAGGDNGAAARAVQKIQQNRGTIAKDSLTDETRSNLRNKSDDVADAIKQPSKRREDERKGARRLVDKTGKTAKSQ
jgi:hypothetical protein